MEKYQFWIDFGRPGGQNGAERESTWSQNEIKNRCKNQCRKNMEIHEIPSKNRPKIDRNDINMCKNREIVDLGSGGHPGRKIKPFPAGLPTPFGDHFGTIFVFCGYVFLVLFFRPLWKGFWPAFGANLDENGLPGGPRMSNPLMPVHVS